MNQGDQQPVGEPQRVFAPSAHGPFTDPTPPLAQHALAGRLPTRREFFEQLTQVLAGQASEGRMRQGRADKLVIHTMSIPHGRLTSRPGLPTAEIAPQVVTTDEAWVLWRCLSEAVASLGEPPAHIHTYLAPTSGRKSA